MVESEQSRIGEHIANLASDDWSDRRAAEDGLREAGKAAVPALIEALSSHDDRVRWGAAKVLGEIRDPAAAPGLVEALEDPDGGVRYVAAQSLIAIGEASHAPLLRHLVAKPGSAWMQEGAHLVLRTLATPTVSPVIRALEGPFPADSVPVPANNALKELESGPSA